MGHLLGVHIQDIYLYILGKVLWFLYPICLGLTRFYHVILNSLVFLNFSFKYIIYSGNFQDIYHSWRNLVRTLHYFGVVTTGNFFIKEVNLRVVIFAHGIPPAHPDQVTEHPYKRKNISYRNNINKFMEPPVKWTNLTTPPLPMNKKHVL